MLCRDVLYVVELPHMKVGGGFLFVTDKKKKGTDIKLSVPLFTYKNFCCIIMLLKIVLCYTVLIDISLCYGVGNTKFV